MSTAVWMIIAGVAVGGWGVWQMVAIFRMYMWLLIRVNFYGSDKLSKVSIDLHWLRGAAYGFFPFIGLALILVGVKWL